MSTTYQKEFTVTEATAICEMLTTLANNGYQTVIGKTSSEPDHEGEGHRSPFVVEIWEYSNEALVGEGQAFLLIDALSEAYTMTPERENS